MSDPFQIDHKTDYNSNQLTIIRLHKINERVQELLFYKNYPDAFCSLLDYYSEIEPKILEYKKFDYETQIKTHIQKTKRLMRIPTIPQQVLYESILELRSAIFRGANAVGVGMTTKDSGRGAAQYG